MISYELAKQLKEAGFPNSQDWFEEKTVCKECEAPYENKPCEKCGWYGGYTFTVKPHISLSELIEACGDNLIMFRAEKEWCVAIMRNGIQEVSYDATYIDEKFDHFNVCSTPEEAVANLWLELNKKNA